MITRDPVFRGAPLLLQAALLSSALLQAECVLSDLTQHQRKALASFVGEYLETPSHLDLSAADVEKLHQLCLYQARFRLVENPSFVFEFTISADLKYVGREMVSFSGSPNSARRAARSRGRADLLESGHPRLGARSGDPDIVVFSDYACPRSKDLWRWLKSFEKQPERKETSIAFRFHPLRTVLSWETARAAACALMQGEDRFWAGHDALFESQDEIARGSVSPEDLLARHPDIDVPRFRACVANNEAGELVRADAAASMRLGLLGTPAVFVSGVRIDGALPDKIEEELRSTTQLRTQGDGFTMTWREKAAIEASQSFIQMLRSGSTQEDLEKKYGSLSNWPALSSVSRISREKLLGTEVAPLNSLSQVQVRFFVESEHGSWRLIFRWDVGKESTLLLSLSAEATGPKAAPPP